MGMMWRCLAPVAAILVAVPALAETGIEYETRIQPKFPGVKALGTLAVLDFIGTDGKDFAIALRAALQAATFDGRPVHAMRSADEAAAKLVIDRPAVAIQAGRTAGAGAVFFGAVTKAAVTKTDFTQERQQCVETNGPLGCKKKATVPTACLRYTGVYTVSLR